MTQIEPYRPPEFKERKRFFSKKMLWSINLVLIPLIYVLSQTGVEKDTDIHVYIEPTEMFDLQKVVFHKDVFDGVGVHWAQLDNSQKVYLGFVLNRQPISSVDIPQYVQVASQVQGGKLWLNIEMPNDRDVIFDALLFVQAWLPEFVLGDSVIIAGDVDESIVATLLENLMGNKGDASDFFTKDISDDLHWIAPQIGQSDFESFYMAYLVLLKRAENTRLDLSWHVKTTNRLLRANIPIDTSLLSPVTKLEFNHAKGLLKKSMDNQMISQAGLVRYLMHQAGYNLPVDYFQSRPLRYQQVTIQRVNEQLNKLNHDKKI